ncbi:AMP-binding protein [Streptomyces albogriseolus]|nr:AMP-binding protein [Streptomyces albogriseolus]
MRAEREERPPVPTEGTAGSEEEDAVPGFTYPELPLDGLLRAAAARDPDGRAVTTAAGAVTFAELDAGADRIAHALRRTVRRGATVAVAGALDAVFPAAYYGTARAAARSPWSTPCCPRPRCDMCSPPPASRRPSCPPRSPNA